MIRTVSFGLAVAIVAAPATAAPPLPAQSPPGGEWVAYPPPYHRNQMLTKAMESLAARQATARATAAQQASGLKTLMQKAIQP